MPEPRPITVELKRIIYQPGKVARIILNRARYKNPISHPLFHEMELAFDHAADDPECKVIVLSGAGSCFSSGDDAMGLTPESAPMMTDGAEPAELIKRYGSEREMWRQYWTQHDYYVHDQWTNKIRRIPKATIAMVHGYAIYMGHSLAVHMDLIFATEDALFLPSGDGTWDWGPRKALEIAYEHRFLTGREAYEYHRVNRIYPDFETLERETLAFANRVAENTSSAIRQAKERVNKTMDIQGFTGDYFDHVPFDLSFQARDVPADEKHRERYEGRGMARTPRAFANLKAKLETEGKKVPAPVLEAIARAASRDDKATWERALHQEWREKSRIDRADADAKVVAASLKKEKA